MESSSTNVHIVGENLVRAFYKLFCLQLCVSSDQWKKHTAAKILQRIWETFLYECNRNNIREITSLIIVTIIPTNLKFAFITFLSFRRNQKQESNFQQVGGPLTRNLSAFCVYWVALYFKGMPNAIDFYKRIFLSVIPARIIVPWS